MVKIPPKNGATFINTQSSTPIRFELPAQGYLNTRNTFLSFDLGWSTLVASANNVRIQNGIQSIFKRVRLLYGSLVLEDIREYHALVRLLIEGAGANTTWVSDQVSISEGVGGIKMYPNSVTAATATAVNVAFPGNVRLMEIQSGNFTNQAAAVNTTFFANATVQQGAIDSTSAPANRPRRYQVQLGLGLFQQQKLLPLKWMAAQLAVEIELCTTTAECAALAAAAGVTITTEAFQLTNLAMICELLEFDGSYDAGTLFIIFNFSPN